MIHRPSIYVILALSGCTATESAPERGAAASARVLPTTSWTLAADQPMRAVKSADLDEDGHLDLLVADVAAGAIDVFLGTGLTVPFAAMADDTITLPAADFDGTAFPFDLGDFDGDAHLDLAVGAPAADRNGTDSGALLLFQGHGDATFSDSSSAPPPDALIVGLTGTRLGSSLTALDIDGDGNDELAVARTDGLAQVTTTSALWATDPVPTLATKYAGCFVHPPGDVDGDGRQDLAVSNCVQPYTGGVVYTMRGLATGFPTTDYQFSAALGDELGLGQYSASFGDVNGDGFDDLVAGAPYRSSNEGAAFVFFGSDHGFFPSNGSLQFMHWGQILDPTNVGQVGWSVLSGFDANGDGFDDLAIGEPIRDDATGGYLGRTWVLPGRADSVTVPPMFREDASQYVTGTLVDPLGGAGHLLWAPGDVDDDGFDDLLIGEATADKGLLTLYHGDADPDSDGDGFSDYRDCGALDPNVYPGAPERPGNGLDDGCDGLDSCLVDADGDGYGSDAVVRMNGPCLTSANLSAQPGDCDDLHVGRSPGTVEIPADGVDQNCDDVDLCYTDGDGDSYGSAVVALSADLTCTAAGLADDSTDCDDTSAAISPSGVEVDGDGIDQDCDGLERCVADGDGDGAGGTELTTANDADCADANEATSSTDCDDADATIVPGADEVTADGVDQDCDGGDHCFADVDADGFAGATTASSDDLDCADAGEFLSSLDCDDSDDSIAPDAEDAPADGIDADCSGADTCFADADGDGFGAAEVEGDADDDCAADGLADTDGDCADDDASVFPGAVETEDGVDQDCDGVQDDGLEEPGKCGCQLAPGTGAYLWAALAGAVLVRRRRAR